MVASDLRYDGNGLVVQNVGGIQPSAHTNLDNANLDPCIIEELKGGCCQDLELGRIDVLSCIQLEEVILNFSELGFLDGLVIDIDAVPSWSVVRCCRIGTT